MTANSIFTYFTILIEMNASPRTEAHNQLAHRNSQAAQVAIPRRSSQEYYQQQQLPSPSSTGSTPPITIPRERKISAGSAGSALAKALSMASVRLFGPGNSPPKISARLQQQATTQTATIPGSPRGFLITEGGFDPQEGQTMKTIERAACMAHAVARFADSKFDLLISGKSANEALLAEEAMVLHIKALSLLELGLSTARQFWSRVSDDTMRTVSVRLNDAVQWMRERFNECLDRASFAGTKCDHDDQNGAGACVEKLLYDRALEMVKIKDSYSVSFIYMCGVRERGEYKLVVGQWQLTNSYIYIYIHIYKTIESSGSSL